MELRELSNNQLIGLRTDPQFRGYVWGESAPRDPVKGPIMIISVKDGGATGRHGCTLIALGELVRVAK